MVVPSPAAPIGTVGFVRRDEEGNFGNGIIDNGKFKLALKMLDRMTGSDSGCRMDGVVPVYREGVCAPD